MNLKQILVKRSNMTAAQFEEGDYQFKSAIEVSDFIAQRLPFVNSSLCRGSPVHIALGKLPLPQQFDKLIK